MADKPQSALRRRLVESYEHLVRRLTRHVDSARLAREAVHETYLRLHTVTEIEAVQNPDGYLFRAALNIARNRQVVDRRYLTASETEALGMVDQAPDPARITEAHSEMELLQRALAQLPARRRAIFEGSWVDGIPHRELATRYGVDVRTVQRELERATAHVRRIWKEYGLM